MAYVKVEQVAITPQNIDAVVIVTDLLPDTLAQLYGSCSQAGGSPRALRRT